MMTVHRGRSKAVLSQKSRFRRKSTSVLRLLHQSPIGLMQATLDLDELYPDHRQRACFQDRFAEFMTSNPAHSRLFGQTGDLLTYRTEQLIPEKSDSRMPLLLVFGNPASHSVNAGMFFASEGNGREHRLWQGLRNADILSFHQEGNTDSQEGDRNKFRRDCLYGLNYDTPFRIGMAVYYSLPTPSSGSKWAGVPGLRVLFGQKALNRIGEFEKNRLSQVIQDFAGHTGTIFVFQKDAYIGLASAESPAYTVSGAQAGSLVGYSRSDPRVRLYGCPPTRYMHTLRARTVLHTFKERILPT